LVLVPSVVAVVGFLVVVLAFDVVLLWGGDVVLLGGEDPGLAVVLEAELLQSTLSGQSH